MREAGHGRVLVTTSNSGILGNFSQSNYAQPMGLVGLAQVLAQEAPATTSRPTCSPRSPAPT